MLGSLLMSKLAADPHLNCNKQNFPLEFLPQALYTWSPSYEDKPLLINNQLLPIKTHYNISSIETVYMS